KNRQPAPVNGQPMLDPHAAPAACDPAAQQQAANVQPASAGKVQDTLNQPMPGGASTQTGGPTADNAAELSQYLQTDGKLTPRTFSAVAAANRDLVALIQDKPSMRDVAA